MIYKIIYVSINNNAIKNCVDYNKFNEPKTNFYMVEQTNVWNVLKTISYRKIRRNRQLWK